MKNNRRSVSINKNKPRLKRKKKEKEKEKSGLPPISAKFNVFSQTLQNLHLMG
jgi:hypothetical protein